MQQQRNLDVIKIDDIVAKNSQISSKKPPETNVKPDGKLYSYFESQE